METIETCNFLFFLPPVIRTTISLYFTYEDLVRLNYIQFIEKNEWLPRTLSEYPDMVYSEKEVKDWEKMYSHLDHITRSRAKILRISKNDLSNDFNREAIPTIDEIRSKDWKNHF